jgi:butyrate kinase
MEKILVINPGSTSTKVALFIGENEEWAENINHTQEELAPFLTVYNQIDFRKNLVLKALRKHGQNVDELDAIASRGGPFAPVKGGAYEINDAMIEKIMKEPVDYHVSLIGAVIAQQIAVSIGKKAYIYDAVSVDEMDPLNKVTGLPSMMRRGQGHNLNMRSAAIQYCKMHGKDYHKGTFIVSHLGGGISVSLHRDGRIVDIIPDEDGCFAPNRAGELPQSQLVDFCFEGHTKQEVMDLLKNKGGLVAWLGTNDTRDVEKMIASGNEKASFIYDAMALSVARNIGKEAATASGKIDQIILTGGIAKSKLFDDMVANRVSWIASVSVVPGENEMSALALGVLRVLRGSEVAQLYQAPKS